MAAIQARESGDGKKHYRVLIRLKGVPNQSATFERLTDAKRWAQQTEASIREGRHFKTSEAKKHTVKELIDRYQSDVLSKNPKKLKSQTFQYEWWAGQIGDYSLADIRPSLISEMREKLLNELNTKGRKRSPATVVRYMAALSHAFSIAVKEWEWLESNPMVKVSKPKEPRGRVRFLSDGERVRLLQACKESNNKYLYPVVVLALSSGMRQNEVMSLKWSQVDFGYRRIILEETKNGERRAIPIVGHALELLLKHEQEKPKSEFLFPSKVDVNKPMDLRKPWHTAILKAEIENFRFHDLRHSAASYLAMNGATLTEIAEILGHKTMQMVRRYSHLSESHITNVVSSMNDKIFK